MDNCYSSSVREHVNQSFASDLIVHCLMNPQLPWEASTTISINFYRDSKLESLEESWTEFNFSAEEYNT